jgi:hypothetical protein
MEILPDIVPLINLSLYRFEASKSIIYKTK